MGLQVSLEHLRERVLLHADMVNSDFRDASEGGEVDTVINAEWRKAYRLLAIADDDYNLDFLDYDTTLYPSGVFPLPATFFKERRVQLYTSGSGGPAKKLRKLRLDELDTYSWSNTLPIGFRLQGTNFVVSPTPPAGVLMRFWFTPAPEDMADDADTIDCVTGLDELIVIGAAKTLLFQEGDIEAYRELKSDYEIQKQEVLADIQNRAEAEQASDVIGVNTILEFDR